MPGILSKLTRRSGVTEADRARLLGEAVRLHREMAPEPAVIAALLSDGAPAPVAEQINAAASARVDREVAASVRLPASATRPINYYFLLGVTPRAGADQIHRAYRRKAKQVHPDRHRGEFVENQWQDLMTVVADASDVLTDPRKRRAYDVFWRQRSKSVAMRYRRQGDLRGDFETRYLWEIAEMAELEEALTTLLEQVARAVQEGGSAAPMMGAVRIAADNYEGAMIEIRTQARTLPDDLTAFSERVRAEMQRKERLVRCLHQLVSSEQTMAGHLPAAREVLAEIREAQNMFELGTARPFI